MRFEYKTQGVCSQKIEFEINGDIVDNIRYIGGCNGNTQGVAKLANGRKVDEVISLLSGIHCGPRPTSCPDQLAQALIQAKSKL